MGRGVRLQNAGTANPSPDQLTDIDRYDYFDAMLRSLAKMAGSEQTATLRQILGVAVLESGRLLKEARLKQPGPGATNGPEPRPATRRATPAQLYAEIERHYRSA